MDSRLLIDAVVRQTTLLIAQLATSAGIRAPLAHLADQVFLELAKEIEQQGVSKKVAADMFGIALRSYQRKVGRLRESVSVSEKTLWQAVLDHVRTQGTSPRAQLLATFRRDDPDDVAAVLSDLVANGLVYCTGRGKLAVYGPTTHSDQEALLSARGEETLLHLVWLALAEPPGLSRDELGQRFSDHSTLLDSVLARLIADGRAQEVSAAAGVRYRASTVHIPVGSEIGWETAVLDHFRAVCTALTSKLQKGGAASADSQLIGGTTLSFELCTGHPFEQEIKGLLTRVRTEVLTLFHRVAAHNTAHPIDEDALARVVFYIGQNYIPCDASLEVSL
jgi:hypothetical protein